MLDLWDMFGEDYSEKVSPPGGGSRVRVRADDGIHLNRTGSAWVSEAVVGTVADSWDDSGSVTGDDGAICWNVGRASGEGGEENADVADQCATELGVPLICRIGERRNPIFLPAGEYVSVSSSWNQVCALRAADRGVTCWGDNLDGRDQVPEGSFKALAAGAWHACGIRPSNEVECWGTQVSGMSAAPAGQYESISVGARHSCVIRPDRSIFCWGSDAHARTAAPDAEYAMVSVGRMALLRGACRHVCVVAGETTLWVRLMRQTGTSPLCRLAATIPVVFGKAGRRCAGETTRLARPRRQAEHFHRSSPGRGIPVVFGKGGEAVCWGNNDHGRADPPGGVFVSLDAGGDISCGVRPDQSIECWGQKLVGQISG